MRTTARSCACAALVLSSCVSQPEPPPASPVANLPPPTLAEQAALQEKSTRPGPHHRKLDPLVGAWTTLNSAVDAEGRETDPVPGRAAIDWTLGGRYLRIDANLEVPNGGTYTWSGFLGYDEPHAEYQWLMVSDLSTGMGVARGQGELAREGIRFVLELQDPRSGGFARATSLLRLLGPDELVLEQLGADTRGLERVLRRTHYRRAKAAAPVTPR
jgi:hypothetical protein